jgi:hypothetical protein
MLGCVCGFFMGATVASRRRPTCRELMRDPDRQPTFAELLMPPTCDRNPDWRRSFNHENINRPTGKPPLRFRRSGDGYSSGPTTPKPDIIPKPQPPGGRLIGPSAAPATLAATAHPACADDAHACTCTVSMPAEMTTLPTMVSP